MAALKAAAAERLAANQAVLDLGVSPPAGSEPLPITSSQMSHLWDGLCAAYRILGFESATKGDNVFRDLVLARIIEPTSKIDASRVLGEVGVEPASYATVKRRPPGYAQPQWRRRALAAASALRAGLGPASLVLFGSRGASKSPDIPGRFSWPPTGTSTWPLTPHPSTEGDSLTPQRES